MLPLQARVDLGAMAMKGYSAFPKAPALLEPFIAIGWPRVVAPDRVLIIGQIELNCVFMLNQIV